MLQKPASPLDPSQRTPVKTYVIFSEQDGQHLAEFEKHTTPLVRNKYIEMWNRTKVSWGEEVSTTIQVKLDEASIVFILVTANLLSDTNVWESEVVPACNLYARKQVSIVPIWVEHCLWRAFNIPNPQGGPAQPVLPTPFSNLAYLPVRNPSSPVIDPAAWLPAVAWRTVSENILTVINFVKADMPPLFKHILFMAASPSTEQRLRIDVEQRKITDTIQRSRKRDSLHFNSQPAVKFNHFVQYLLDKPSPQFVHISLHSFRDGIAIEGDAGTSARIVSGQDLYDIFKQCIEHKAQQNYPALECVLLNACYSDEHAQLISTLGVYAIGMKEPINDREAVAFAEGFYVGLGLGQPYPDAYSTAILHMKSQKDVPMLFKNGERIK